MNQSEIRFTIATMLDTWDALTPAQRADALAKAAKAAAAPQVVPSATWKTCGGCSGHAEDVVAIPSGRGQVGTCSGCGALLGCFARRADLVAFVNVEEWDAAETSAESTRFFDVELAGGRIHGWFNPATSRIVQIG